jgi:uncharacterized protein (TIGR00369 family)
MPFDQSLVNRGGRVHGGAIASLLISAARIGAAESEQSDRERRIRPLAASIGFLSVPRHGRLIAVADVVRRGRDVAHTRVNVVDEGGATVADASIVVGLVDPDGEQNAMTGHAAGPVAQTNLQGSPVPDSPYLSAAGILILPSAERSARALLPKLCNRAADPWRVDEGAIGGLADSCAAFAAHLDEPGPRQAGGVTVSLALAFHAALDDDLVGIAAVSGRDAGCFLAAIDVVGATSGIPVASGFAVYRLAV